MKALHLIPLACLAITSFAQATPFVTGVDPRPSVSNGRIVTGGYDDMAGTFVADVRHFGYTLNPTTFFTADPGFNAVAGSGLPSGQQLRFDVVRRLQRWDGAGSTSFDDASAAEALRFAFGAANAVVNHTTDNVSGFSISNIGSGGTLHRHLNATLLGNTTPRPGLYFTALRLSVSGGTVTRSDALYIAYNNGLSATDFTRGLTYLADPTPGDTNFDTRVNFDDLLALAQNYGNNPDASWFDGDFNRDRAVSFGDLLSLAQNYGNASAFESDWALAQSMVPEPTSLALLGAIALMPRRRRPTESERRG